MTSRRQYLVGAGSVAAAILGVGAGNAVAQNATPEGVYITNVDEAGESFVVENRGDAPFGLTGYHVNFEYDGQVDQVREFGPDTTVPEGGSLTVPAGGEFVVATGAENVADADVVFNYEGPVLNNDGTDTYAILTPDGSEVIARSDDDVPPADTPTPEQGTGSATAEADTATGTTTESATATEADATTTAEADTRTPTQTQTDADTAAASDSETTAAQTATDASSSDDC